jgi:hypothetical protein
MFSSLKRRAALVTAAVGIVSALLATTTSASAATLTPQVGYTTSGTVTPLDSGPHQDGLVIISVDSLGGSGPDITTAYVGTPNIVIPEYSVIYLMYGANVNSLSPLLVKVVEEPNVIGWTFGVYRNLTPGKILCGEISGFQGRPCITIG